MLLVAGALVGWNFHSKVNGQQTEDKQDVQEDAIEKEKDKPDAQVDEEQAATPSLDEDTEFKKVLGVTLTADDLIEKMKSDHASFAGEGKLEGAELEKAISILRERYSFQSLRKRMTFQENPVPASIRRNEAVEGEIPQYSLRGQALAMLHSEEVEEFINRPGQGFRRTISISPYDIESRSQWAKRIETQPVDSKLLGEPTIALKPFAQNQDSPDHFMASYSMSESGMPTTNLAQMFHRESAHGFTNPESFGFVRNLDEVAGFEAHQARFPEDWDGSIRIQNQTFFDKYQRKPIGLDVEWKINRLQLVSLLLHDEPRVYESENLPNMEELSGSNAETRTLNDFESNSLEKLYAGEEAIMHATPNRLVMLGALRANTTCLQCHSVKENELLGAFSYEFLRDPKVEIKIEDH